MSFHSLLYFLFLFHSTPFTLSFLLTFLFIAITLGLFWLYRRPLQFLSDDQRSAHTKSMYPSNCLICHIMCFN
jgi:hypothetical protein